MTEAILSVLLERCRRDHHAWINGDASGYELPKGGSILGAVGGWARGGPDTSGRQRSVAAQWKRGHGTVELVNGAVHDDLAWLVMIERATVEFAAEPEGRERRWDLRVTEIFQLLGGAWCRVHRHAGPLVDRHAIPELTTLLE